MYQKSPTRWLGMLLIACVSIGLPTALSAQSVSASVDESFEPHLLGEVNVNAIVPGRDGTLFILGNFVRVDGRLRTGLAQLDSTGRIAGFEVSSTRNLAMVRAGDIWGMTRSKNDTWLLWGGFSISSATERFDGLTRLAGSNIDGEFHHLKLRGSETITNGYVRAALSLDSGDILIGGGFTHLNDAARNNLARLKVDGTPEGAFNAKLGSGPNGPIFSLAVQKDGKILVAGEFSSFNGTPRARLARLKQDGDLDLTFDPAEGPNGWVFTMKAQEDGKILLGGSFSTVGGISRPGLARLLPDGKLDDTFQPDLGENGTSVRAIEILADQSMLVGGMLSATTRSNPRGIVRLNHFGATMPGFEPDTGTHPVNSLLVQEDGRILIGGSFTTVNGLDRAGLARLQGGTMTNPPAGTLRTPSTLAGNRIGLTLVGTPGTTYSVQSSVDSVVWQESTNFTAAVANTHLVLPSHPAWTMRFYRAQQVSSP